MAGPVTAPPTVGGAQPTVPRTQPTQPQPAPPPPPAETPPAAQGDAEQIIANKTPATEGRPAEGGGLVKEEGFWTEGRTKGEQPVFEKGLPRVQQQETNWPIITQPIFGRGQFPDHERPDTPPRNNDDGDRHWHEGVGAHRTNLRQGLIRDFLIRNLQETILETRAITNNALVDIQGLTRTAADQLFRTYNDPVILTGRTLEVIAKEITHILGKELNPNSGSGMAIPYDRAIQIASLVLRQISGNVGSSNLQLTDQKILDALVFLQLCCRPGRYIDQMRQITGHKPCILPDDIAWSSFRDVGLLAANLMRDGASLKSTASLDAAVQKFVKLLLASNALGILLAAVRLSADARMGRIPDSSIIALVRVYELIAQLMIATERAMKQAAETAAHKPAELARTDKGLAFAGALEAKEAEAALRQYLAFNPAANADSGASAFFSEQVAESSARAVVDSSAREISEWLSSGRHRFVVEADIGKPVGIVIDGNTDECFTASQVRVVLVRDGSVLGWHILRSSLVG